MKSISIDQLSPGENVLSAEKVQKYRAALAAGRDIDPITVIELDGCLIVRDGNNRVRAFIEHFRAANRPWPEIPAVLSDRPLGGTASSMLPLTARYYGNGVPAFLSLPCVSAAEYVVRQAVIGRKIFLGDGTEIP